MPQFRATLLRLREALDLIQPYWDDVVPPYWDHLVPPYSDTGWGPVPVRPEISGFVPRSALIRLLERLGYFPVDQPEELAVWVRRQDRRGLPQVVFVPPPMMYHAASGESGYGKQSVLNLYDWIIWFAKRRGASVETLRMLQNQRDQFARELE